MDPTAIPDLGAVPQDLVPFSQGGLHYVYRYRLSDGTMVAIKTLQVGEVVFERPSPIMQQIVRRWWRVIRIWARFRHPNVVQLIGKATLRGRFAVVYEWYDYGGVRNYLEHHPTADRYRMSARICEGLKYLHENNFVHGNMKGDKILLSNKGVPRIVLSTGNKIFENSLHADEIPEVSFRWEAPEILAGEEPTSASDVYSLGMTILETITRGVPYAAISAEDRVGLKVIRGQIPPRPTDSIPGNNAGNAIWVILNECWSFDPSNRPAAVDVCAVMRTVYQVADGLALRPELMGSRLIVWEDTSVQDLVSHFEKRGLTNYTEILQQTDIASASPFSDTALANVYRINLTGQQHVAVKCVKHATVHKKLKRAARELACWSSYKHENILPVLGFAVVKKEFAMISPWMSNGCVTDYVRMNPNCNRLELCTQVARAVAYLHEHNVVHGDIKGPNVLVSDTGAAKVTDFGVSIADHQEIEFSATAVGGGTRRWQAPEILQGPREAKDADIPMDGNKRINKSYPRDGDSTKEGDVYALGMTMIEIYSGARPYGLKNWSYQMQQDIITGQLRPSRPLWLPLDNVGNALWELMKQCWAGSPDERPTSKEVYDWLASVYLDTGKAFPIMYACYVSCVAD